MNTARLKLLTWTIAGLLGAALVLYIALFLRHRAEILAHVPQDRMAKVLENVPSVELRVEAGIDRGQFERALKGLDWTGAPPPKVEIVEAPVAQTETGPEPVSKFVKLRGIKVDAAEPELGEVIFKYSSDSMVTTVTSQDGTVRKQVGARLDGRLEYIYVKSITDAGVEFGFEDAQRPSEFLTTNDYPLDDGFVVVGDEVLSVSSAQRASIPVAPRQRGPNPKTERLSPDRYRLGFEDVEYINTHYSEILANEVSYARHRDLKTGKYDGIEIKSVKSGSIAASHGVQSGDVIKSINGHPVTSTSDAIQFVKTHQGDYDRWEVEVLNKGQTRTITYINPQN